MHLQNKLIFNIKKKYFLMCISKNKGYFLETHVMPKNSNKRFSKLYHTFTFRPTMDLYEMNIFNCALVLNYLILS